MERRTHPRGGATKAPTMTDPTPANPSTDDTSPILGERIRELRHLEKQLKSLREMCLGGQDAQHCGILNELTEIAKSPVSGHGREGHVHGSHAASGAHKSHHKH